MTELFIVCAARAEHVATVVRPALENGRVVVCDRFADASIAYQSDGRGLERAVVVACSDAAARGLRPGLTLLVDVPPEVSRARVRSRSAASGDPIDRFEREDVAFHRRVRDGYLAIARAEPERVHVLDGTLPPDELAAAAWSVVAPQLGAAC